MTDYPNVPDAPGVPTVPRDPNAPIDNPPLLQGDSVTVTGSSNLPLWGILLDGKTVLEPDNFVTFEYQKGWAIADYQLEKGSFESYDKVEMPFEIRLQLSCGGSIEKRADFLSSVEAIVGDLKLYTVVTPEQSYADCNIGRYDYRRTNTNGAGLLLINLYFEQIRAIAAQEFSQTNTSPASPSDVKDPGAAAQVNDGTVQAAPLSSAQQSKASNFLSDLVTAAGIVPL